jgi:hypothetical protein
VQWPLVVPTGLQTNHSGNQGISTATDRQVYGKNKKSQQRMPPCLKRSCSNIDFTDKLFTLA